MSSNSESEGPTPAKKSRQSEVRPSEAFKSEYAREFASDMITVNLQNVLNFKQNFRHPKKAMDFSFVVCARQTMALERPEKQQSLDTTSQRLIKMRRKQRTRQRRWIYLL
jgi:hypothetical protein